MNEYAKYFMKLAGVTESTVKAEVREEDIENRLKKKKPKGYKLPIELMQSEASERDVTKMPYRPTAEAFLKDVKGNLVAKYMSKADGTGFLKMPGGGVDPGEDPKTGLLREIMEETGITPKNLKLEKRVKWDWPESWPMFDKQKKRYAKFRGEDSHIFTGDVGDIVDPTSEEGDEWDGVPSMPFDEAIGIYDKTLDKESPLYQGAGYDPYKKAQLAAVIALSKRKMPKTAADNRSKVIQFVKDNPKLDDDKFHEFVEGLGMDPHDAEEMIYDFVNKNAGEDKIPGGLADDKKPSDFDSDQLAKGIKVEMEHTSDPAIAKEIAMDHIEEDPKYYDKLEKIEKHATGPATLALIKACRPGINLGKDNDIKPEDIGSGAKLRLAKIANSMVSTPSSLKENLSLVGSRPNPAKAKIRKGTGEGLDLFEDEEGGSEKKPLASTDSGRKAISHGAFLNNKIAKSEELKALIKAKLMSDNRNYPEKHAILQKLLKRRGDDFNVDSEDGHVFGLTHKPTNFKIHIPKDKVPAGFGRHIKQEGRTR